MTGLEEQMSDNLDEIALEYHRSPRPGKISIEPTKELSNQRDLSLAYSPGVAAACRVIVDDPLEANNVTSRANLVGVVTNGTAVLGLGAIGPLASKPVMEGKAVLFKKFAGIDVFDIEVDAMDPHRFVDVVAALEPTFGGINLEDIKAPECFVIEDNLRERMNIPVFHDDQHGTAIVVGAAVYNALRLVKKQPSDIKLVASGAGAAATACLNLLVSMGVKRENIWVTDIEGVLHTGRVNQMHERQAVYCQDTDLRTLDEVIADADVFLGCSAPGVLKPEMLKKMAEKPIVMALANPEPEISPTAAREARPDAIIATGRSDYANQVNNVLCFPFLFRGALDVGATTINEEMKIAAVRAIADLAMKTDTPDMVRKAYAGQELTFGPDYLIPKPFDPRLIESIAPAVARAAMDSGVATRPIYDFDAYKEQLGQFVYRSGLVMKPIFDRAKTAEEEVRVVFVDGEEERVLRAVQAALDEGLCKPMIIGRREIVEHRIERYGVNFTLDDGRVDLIDPQSDPRFKQYWTRFYEIMCRKGVSPDDARRYVRTRPTAIGALALDLGDADAMICGVEGRFKSRVEFIEDIVGLNEGVAQASTLQMLVMRDHTIFIADANVSYDPTVDHLVETTLLASETVRRFGIEPRVAFLSHSNFGRLNTPTAVKMREAVGILRSKAPDLIMDGEMHADSALDPEIRERFHPESTLQGRANLLIMPSLDAASISFDLLKSLGDGLPVGPMLMGVKKTAYVSNNSVTVRGLVNMIALAVSDVLANRETEGHGQ